MLLSRVRLDMNQLDRDTLLRVLVGDAYAAHQLLWKLFSDDDQRRFLFRQEIESEQSPSAVPKGLPLFYVLSDREPAQSFDWLEVESKRFDPQLRSGDRLGFKLRANPTVARPAGAGKRSQRSDVMMHAKFGFPQADRNSPECQAAMEAAAIRWLARQGDKAGFALRAETAVETYRQHELSKRNGGNRTVQFSSVDYSGLLEVTDADRFIEAMARGFGRAKAFGCGLMLIRRVD
nr:type I-E CRISPR-associated protein Cas6/Cse3/CasE [Salinisphaera halophila]